MKFLKLHIERLDPEKSHQVRTFVTKITWKNPIKILLVINLSFTKALETPLLFPQSPPTEVPPPDEVRPWIARHWRICKGKIYIIKEKHQSKEPSKYIHFKQNLSSSYWKKDGGRGLQSSLFRRVEILSKYHSLHPFLNWFSIPFYNVLKYDLWKVRYIRIYKVHRICTRNFFKEGFFENYEWITIKMRGNLWSIR